jgi:hypothetical protein
MLLSVKDVGSSINAKYPKKGGLGKLEGQRTNCAGTTEIGKLSCSSLAKTLLELHFLPVD